MRVVAGEWRGRQLRTPEGDTTRPTADRTRETLFSMLASRLGSFDGIAIMDLFAGSGALGLEALSRGAAHCLFAEQDPAALRALRANIAALKAQDRCDVRATSVMALGRATRQFDLVLLDPPYESSAGAVAIDKLARLGWFAPSAWIALETSRRETPEIRGFETETIRDSGRARLHLIRPAQAA